MKPAAAFAAGLWTGALVMAAVGVFHFRLLDRSHPETAPDTQQQLATRVQLLQKEQARAAAEVQRLRETVADLRSNLTARLAGQARMEAEAARGGVRRIPYRRAGSDAWIVDSLRTGDAQALARLERIAGEGNPQALDALALLADRDGGEALMRAWSSSRLDETAKLRATMLLGATVEVNPSGEEWLRSLADTVTPNLELITAAVTGLGAPDFPSALLSGTGLTPPPHFKPDYAFRLRLLDYLRAAVADEKVQEYMERVRRRLESEVSPNEPTAP